MCHCLEGRAATLAPSCCRATDIANDVGPAIEQEANIFASELLIPEAAVREAWDETPEVDRVSARLDVSPVAIGWPLFNLGLVAERPA